MRENHQKFIDGLEMALTPVQAAKRAGFKDSKGAASRLLRHPDLAADIGRIYSLMQSKFRMSLSQVHEGIAEAIQMARLISDTFALTRGF